MSEGGKAIDREDVAARRAALTDGRWRNREGIGMYQRSTSNALRNILSGVRSAIPSLSRAKSKSRSRSNSPIKLRSPAKRSPAKRSPTKRSPAKKTAPVPEELVEVPEASPSRLPPVRSPSPVPEVESIAAASPRVSTIVSSPSASSPVRPSPKVKQKQKAEAKKTTKTKVKSGLKLQGSSAGSKSKPTPALPKKPTVSEPEEDEEADLEAATEGAERGDEEDEPVETASKPHTTVSRDAGGTEVDESVVVLDDSVALEEPEPEPQPEPRPKTKSRIQTIIPEPLQRITQKAAKPRAVSGSKRPSPDDEDGASDMDSSERAGGSAAKRPKTDKAKSKSKTSAKKGKPRKTAAKPKAKASKAKSKARATSSQPEPSGSKGSTYHTVPTSPTPPPQDIMVPLQDSPPSRPKDEGKRRRYTLMPVRTTEQMAHPDFDPIDCIGWQ